MYTETANSSETSNCFQSKFKYYKAKVPKPSLLQVVNIDDNNNNVIAVDNKLKTDPRSALLGLTDLSKWKLYSFKKHPGLFMIKDPFTTLGQRYWIRRCLEDYPKRPNKKNIDIELDIQDWWAECFHNDCCDRRLQKKLRWTTLGYHHDWDTKMYTDENRSDFPADLAELSDIVANYLGYSDFKAEAAIVNYYHMDSTLSGHTDHSEVNLDAPLLSFSFGQSAIFLIGGVEKTEEPTAIMINSGDIVIMSKQARLCYHAVPKILPTSYSPWKNELELVDNKNATIGFKMISNTSLLLNSINRNRDSDWSSFNDYISESRINMNVRQVLKLNQNSLKETFVCNS